MTSDDTLCARVAALESELDAARRRERRDELLIEAFQVISRQDAREGVLGELFAALARIAGCDDALIVEAQEHGGLAARAASAPQLARADLPPCAALQRALAGTYTVIADVENAAPGAWDASILPSARSVAMHAFAGPRHPSLLVLGAQAPNRYGQRDLGTMRRLIVLGRQSMNIVTRLDLAAERDRLISGLLAARDEAERASQAKSQFLTTMSHELRTPLNAVIGYSEMMAEAAVAEARSGDFADHLRVLSAARHLLAMIDEILDYAETENNSAATVRAEPVDVGALAQDAIEMIRPAADANAVTLACEVAEDARTAHSDGAKIRRCLLHLLSNAVKFTKAGEVRLSVSRDRVLDVDWLLFEVLDTGIGIAPEQIERVFEPFTQADPSTSRAYGGAGLGLAVARSLARLLGGDIAVSSKPGEGSVFTLLAPLRYQGARVHSEASARRAA